MTANGLVVAVAGVLALAAGRGFGYPVGVPAAAVCAVLLIAGLPVPPWPGRVLRLALSVGDSPVSRGDTVTVTLVPAASAAGAVAGLRVGGELYEVPIGGRDGTGWTSPPLPRGPLTITVDRVESRGLLGLWRRRIRFTVQPLHVPVLPRHAEVDGLPEVADLEQEGRPLLRGAGTGSAFAGLRGYQPGDDLRHIDWAASARSGGGELQVRQFTPAHTEDPVVVLDRRLPPGARGPESFEVAVDLAYSFVLAGTGLLIDGEPEPMHDPVTARDALVALVPGAAPAGGFPDRRPDAVTAVITATTDDQKLRLSYGNEVLIVSTSEVGLAEATTMWSRLASR